ncbi:hypothetical protein ACFL0M_13585 [Thermodesulfobacteriota bacterium]
MITPPVVLKQMEQTTLKKLGQLPLVGFYAKTRGWLFVLAWTHRITGILLVLYLWFHIFTLNALKTPAVFETKMSFYPSFLFVFLEWALAVPVIFHALNGGRLILYEVFQNRADDAMIRWVLSLAATYILLVGLMMIRSNQIVSPVFFWICMLIISICLCSLVALKIRHSGNSLGWKLQRITAGFLVIMVPAHLLFMHLQPSIGHDAVIVIARMQNIFIKIVDLALVIGGLYHGGYGLLSIAKDYLSTRTLQYGCTTLIFLISAAFAWAGIKLTLFI